MKKKSSDEFFTRNSYKFYFLIKRKNISFHFTDFMYTNLTLFKYFLFKAKDFLSEIWYNTNQRRGDYIMLTKLNETVENFFQLTGKDFNYEEIQKNFDFDGKDENEYGNLLHAALHQHFDEEKVLKFIKLLLENGYDVNYKGKSTGYNFIQLMLYGYTDDEGEDYSYSQEFILKLISLAKKYNLDVNTKDNDGDSIVHTAIASEVYEGEIIPILDALGEKFDLQCKDNKGNDLKSAFDLYKSLAKEENLNWYSRLEREEKALKNRLKVTQKSTLLPSQEKNTQILVENQKKSGSVLEKDSSIEEKEISKSLVEENKISKNSMEETGLGERLVEDKINKSYRKEKQEFDKSTLEKKKGVVQYIEEECTQENLTHEIKTELTLANGIIFIQKINQLNDNQAKKELLLLLKKLDNQLSTIIEIVKEQEELMKEISKSSDEINYNNLTLKELNSLLEQNKEFLLKNRESILERKQKKLEICIQEILNLEQIEIFEDEELWNVIFDTALRKNRIKKKK